MWHFWAPIDVVECGESNENNWKSRKRPISTGKIPPISANHIPARTPG